MQRVTISIDEALAETFDGLVKDQGYQNRSEAVRDVVRKAIEASRLEVADGEGCIANLSYVCDHRTRDIAARLARIAHDHHDLIVSSNQVPLDHESSFVSTFLKGPISAVRKLSDHIRAERGVRFGAVNVVSVEPNDDHEGADDHRHVGHAHLSPRPG
jgi:CopG family nickel-responsive transcriptional regulator